MRENPFQDPYDLGYADGKYMAEQRIAELEAKASQAWETCQKAVERGMKIEAENQRLRDIEAAAKRVVHTMRGSGGINPDGAKALLDLQALLEGE